MNESQPQINPFKVFTPEDMNAEKVLELFVDPFTDFNKIQDVGHTMINGPRGCGKSMIFRYMLPDCQCLARNSTIKDLSFLAFLISIKNTGPNLTEFRRLTDKHADAILNEHCLVAYIASKAFYALSRYNLPKDEESATLARRFYSGAVVPLLQQCGMNEIATATTGSTVQEIFEFTARVCDMLYFGVVRYARRLAFLIDTALPYDSALCGFSDFLLPLFQELRTLPFLPNAPIYLLIDDADYLNQSQTIALNSWISTRTQQQVSIKVSTQLRYKTFATNAGLPIQSPHDYQLINIADIYTTRRSRYMNRMVEIVQKRLVNAGIHTSPQEFFPPDQEKEKEVEAIALRFRDEWNETGRGNRPEDDAIRYARPEYIKSLAGKSKSLSTYSYSGFEHLVHISSGLVRYFLEAAALMFDEEQSNNPDHRITAISPGVQNQIVRDEADSLMFSEFDKIRLEEESALLKDPRSSYTSDEIRVRMDRLQRLIMALGGAFKLKLLSNDSERRVFSVAMSGRPDREVVEIFDLGVRYGYFHRSSIGNKDGTGRTRLYVLTRRLAPYFSLDPTSFAGYLWVPSEILLSAMENPDALLRKMKHKGVDAVIDTGQLSLFD